LGKRISFDTDSNSQEIDRRIQISWRKYWSFKELLKGNYSLKYKKNSNRHMHPTMPYIWFSNLGAHKQEQIKDKNMPKSNGKEHSQYKTKGQG
jgi:hypothetical protein